MKGMSPDEAEQYQCRQAAKRDVVWICYHQDETYEYGWGVPENEEMAQDWRQKAKDPDITWVPYRMALLCQSGEGVAKDDRAAAEWYQRAAVLGHAKSLRKLAEMYRDGVGVMQSNELAVEMYQKAAENGDTLTRFDLAELYRTGTLVDQNEETAQAWYKKASASLERLSKQSKVRDKAAAAFCLARLHRYGWGVPQDFALAARQYQTAADLGHAQAVSRWRSSTRREKGFTGTPSKPENCGEWPRR